MIIFDRIKKDNLGYGAHKVYTSHIRVTNDEVDPELFADYQLKDIYKNKFDVIKLHITFVIDEENNVEEKETLVFRLSDTKDGIMSYMSNINEADGKISVMKLTESEGEIVLDMSEYSVGGSGDAEVILTTHAELLAMKNGGLLTPGALYRITDYTCTTTQEDTRSAGHQFDIIVRALSESELSEEAFAIQHEGDTYFANSKLSAWKLWYCLENDTTRFRWADSVNGKGVIYRMIDEFNNDIPYDFKNIQFTKKTSIVIQYFGAGYSFKYYRDTSLDADGYFGWTTRDEISYGAQLSYWTDTEQPTKESYIYFSPSSESGLSDLHISNVSVISFDDSFVFNKALIPGFMYNQWGQDYTFVRDSSLDADGYYGWRCARTPSAWSNPYCFTNTLDISTSMTLYSDTSGSVIGFGGSITSVSTEEGTFDDSLTGSSYSVEIDKYIINGVQLLNDICFRSYLVSVNAHNNTFGNQCNSITFGNNCYNNTFGYECTDNVFGDSCHNNIFGNYCFRNTFGYRCYSNTFGYRCHDNTFGDLCRNNTFCNECYSNIFGNDCYSNIFGAECGENSFGKFCSMNTFDSNCNRNEFDDTCSNNTFGDNCRENTFGQNCVFNIFNGECHSNTFGNDCFSNTFGINCIGNIFGGHCQDIIFGNRCLSNIFGSDPHSPISYVMNVTVDSGCSDLFIVSDDTNADDTNYLKNVYIHLGVNNAYLTVPDRNLPYETNFVMAGTNTVEIPQQNS